MSEAKRPASDAGGASSAKRARDDEGAIDALVLDKEQ